MVTTKTDPQVIYSVTDQIAENLIKLFPEKEYEIRKVFKKIDKSAFDPIVKLIEDVKKTRQNPYYSITHATDPDKEFKFRKTTCVPEFAELQQVSPYVLGQHAKVFGTLTIEAQEALRQEDLSSIALIDRPISQEEDMELRGETSYLK